MTGTLPTYLYVSTSFFLAVLAVSIFGPPLALYAGWRLRR